jgi:hypothetical protein
MSSLGFKNNLALTGDGVQFRKLRKAYGNFLSARSSLAYRDAQLKHARKMADEIEKCPEKWHSYLSRCGSKHSISWSKVLIIFLDSRLELYSVWLLPLILQMMITPISSLRTRWGGLSATWVIMVSLFWILHPGVSTIAATLGAKERLTRPDAVVEHVPRWIGKFIPSVKYVHDYAPTIEEFHQRPFDAVMKSLVSCPDEPQLGLYLMRYRKRGHWSRHS